MASLAVGIDLGTTNSVVAVSQGGRARVLATGDGAALIPSVVSFHPNGQTWVGASARARRAIDPTNTIFSTKRLLGRPFNSEEVRRAKARFAFELREGPDSAILVHTRVGDLALPEISALILREIRRVGEQALGEKIERAVVTVPANFNELQRTATKVACKIADLDVVRILNEPTAAALAYGYGRGTREKLAVFDFGGGTFDVTLLELAGNVFEVLATAGDTFLGGDDIDLLITENLADALLRTHRIDARQDRRAYETLRAAAEQAKIDLSEADIATIRVPEIGYGPGGVALEFKTRISRLELERLAAPLIGRTLDVCAEAVKLAGLAPSEFHNVLLVGGSSRIPVVRSRVAEFFGRTPKTNLPPEQVVGMGAAILAEALAGPKSRPRPSAPAPAAPAQPRVPGSDPRRITGSTGVSGVRGVGVTRPAVTPAGSTFSAGDTVATRRRIPTDPGGTGTSTTTSPIDRPRTAPTAAAPGVGRPSTRPPVPGSGPAVRARIGTNPGLAGANTSGVIPSARPSDMTWASLGRGSNRPAPLDSAHPDATVPDLVGAARSALDQLDEPSLDPITVARPAPPADTNDPLDATTAMELTRPRRPRAPVADTLEDPTLGAASPPARPAVAPAPSARMHGVIPEYDDDTVTKVRSAIMAPPAVSPAPPLARTDAPARVVPPATDAPVQRMRASTILGVPAPLAAPPRATPPPTFAPATPPPMDPAPMFAPPRAQPMAPPPPAMTLPAAPMAPPAMTMPSGPMAPPPAMPLPMGPPASLAPPPAMLDLAPQPASRPMEPAGPRLTASSLGFQAVRPGAPAAAPPSAAPPSPSTAPPPLLLDVTPLSLGIETLGGMCEMVIPRNATIPVEQTREFATSYDGQDAVKIRIAQGESRRFGDNQALGELELVGITRAPRGEVKIAVTFELDADGTLNVRAREQASGLQTATRVTLLTMPRAADVATMTQRQRGQA